MKKEFLSKLRSPLRILLSVSILAAGVCLMAACVVIYRSGDQPFSREAVAAAFRPISLPVFFCLGMIVLSFLMELLVPRPAEEKVPPRQTHMLLQRLQDRIDLSLCSDELRTSVLSLRSSRKLFNRTGHLILILSSILFLTYGTNPENFHSSNINESMIRAMYWLVPCTVVPFLFWIIAAQKNLASMKAEIELLKSAPKECKAAVKYPRNTGAKILYLRTALLLIGAVILVFGFLRGGTTDVLTKAVNICTECIGLG